MRDGVLINSRVKARPFWQMGCVTHLIEEDDSRVCSVYVRKSGEVVNLYSNNALFPLEFFITFCGVRRTESAFSTFLILPCLWCLFIHLRLTPSDPKGRQAVAKEHMKRWLP